MKLQFKEQDFQVNAVQAVVDCFEGQPLKTNRFTLERSKEIIQKVKQDTLGIKTLDFDIEEEIGYRNSSIQLLDTQILKNLSQILPHLPLLTRKAVLSQVIAQITVFNKKIEVRVGEKIYNINFKKEASTNKKFVEATIERDRRDSNSRPPA